MLKIANIAQTVNILGPILTRGDEMLLQSIFYVFEMFSRRRRGVSLRPLVSGPVYEGKTNGTVPCVDSSAILGDGVLQLFLTNRSQTETAHVEVVVADRTISALQSAEILTGPAATAANTWEMPDVVATRPFSGVSLAGGDAVLELPPLSAAALTLQLR